MEDNHPGWAYSKDLDTWLYGTEEHGAGVLLEDGKWYVNVCHPLVTVTIGMGSYPDFDQAIKAAEDKLLELDRELNNG